jgi:hypothetical protein
VTGYRSAIAADRNLLMLVAALFDFFRRIRVAITRIGYVRSFEWHLNERRSRRRSPPRRCDLTDGSNRRELCQQQQQRDAIPLVE